MEELGEPEIVVVVVGEEDQYRYALLSIQHLPLHLHSLRLVDDLWVARKEDYYLEGQNHRKQQRREQLCCNEQRRGGDSNKHKRMEIQGFDA